MYSQAMAAELAGSTRVWRSSRWRTTGSLLLAMAIALGMTACGDDGDSGDGGEGEPSAGGDVTAACDALEDLAHAIQDVSDTASASTVEAQVQGPLDEFASAAAQSGDEELAQLAENATTAFADYLGGDSQANTVADRTLDAAGSRCLQLGATNDFPQES